MRNHEQPGRGADRRIKSRETSDVSILAQLTGDMKAPGAPNFVKFAVSDVALADTSLSEVSYRQAIEHLLGGMFVESCPSRLHTTLVPCFYHAFVHSVHLAFDEHRPLTISPDHVWLLICQGFAAHVNANAESLRHKLVRFAGKTRINVRRDDFVKGSIENPWEEVLPEFTEQLRLYLGDTAEILTPRFSTTRAVETAACQITLMDGVKPYFEYGFASGCGIPSISLEGVESDWNEMLMRARAFRAFDLEWWIDPLIEGLEQFRNAAAGHADTRWWRSFYKIRNESGGPYINGHILKFFPYLKKLSNGTTPRVDSSKVWGLNADVFPSGLSRAPFQWSVLGPGPRREYPMQFIGGFVGIRQNSADMTLRPEIGWAVCDRRCG